MKPTKPFPERARARRRALQALYQWQIGGGPMRRIIEQFNEEQDMAIADGAYFSELLLGVEEHLAAIDASCGASATESQQRRRRWRLPRRAAAVAVTRELSGRRLLV